MKKKLPDFFEDEFTSFSDEWFQNEKNIEAIKSLKTNKEELVGLQRERYLSWLSKAIEVISKKEKPYETFSLDFDCPISSVYIPNEAYLNKIVESLELLTKIGNENYLDLVAIHSGDIPVNNEFLSSIVVDNKYFFTFHPKHGNNFIVSVDNRFSGLIPFLFRNGYTNIYERMLIISLCLINRYSYKVGKLIISLLNFLKENDKSNYLVFKSKTLPIIEKDVTAWNMRISDTSSANYFGNGFFFKQDYLNSRLSDLLEV